MYGGRTLTQILKSKAHIPPVVPEDRENGGLWQQLLGHLLLVFSEADFLVAF
jgi:hypothetical protein